MAVEPDQVRLVSKAADRVCHLLWLFQRQEPEVVALVERRGSAGFPHYLTSRLGVVGPASWGGVVYIAPTSLVDHLLPRCLALDPPGYVSECLTAAGAALHRLLPAPPPHGLGDLADLVQPTGPLPAAWAALPRSGDPHRDAIRDAMVIREERAHGHYLAASELELLPVELLILTALWRGQPAEWISKNFKWSEPEMRDAVASLEGRGWVDQNSVLTDLGRRTRDQIEARTEELAGRSMADIPESVRGELVAGLSGLASI